MLKKIYYVEISLKSGNSIGFWADKCIVRKDEITCKNAYPGSKDYLMYLESKEVIEAVMVKRTGYRFLRWEEIKE